MFSAYVTAGGHAWADFDVYMPQRWADDLPRRRAAGIPEDLKFATKPQLAIDQAGRLAAGLPLAWVAAGEVYGRSGDLRKACGKAGLAYVLIIPCDYQVTTAAGTVIRADQAAADAVFERRSCGTGSKGPRISDWALIATGRPLNIISELAGPGWTARNSLPLPRRTQAYHRIAAGNRVSYVIPVRRGGRGPCSGQSAAAVVALGKDLGTHACQHRVDIAALPSGLVQDQAGQPQRRHHRVSTPREAEMKHLMRGPRALVVPRVDRFGVSEAVQDLIERFRLPPVYAPARHLRPAFLPRQLPTAISAAPSYGRACGTGECTAFAI